jgi:RNase P subunit RPR2
MAHLGFKCKSCDRYAIELYNCEIKFDNNIATAMFCKRCLKKFGLIKKENKEGGEIYGKYTII